MSFGRAPTREVYAGLDLPRAPRRKGAAKRFALLALICMLALLLYLALYLRSLSGGTALSDAQDMVTLAISDTVNRVLSERNFSYGDFVTLEKGADGRVIAVTTDTVRMNLLSAEILAGIAAAAENGQLDVSIPLGDLLGAGILQGAGPNIPVRVGMMTSSSVRFESDFISTGINQSRHTITLLARVDIDLLIPWGSMHSTVETEIPVAETVIVGEVPDTYVNLE